MKKILFTAFISILSFAAFAQVKLPPKEKPKENKTPAKQQANTYTAPAKEAQVVITWLGPGSAKLLFNTEEYFFTEGQEKTLQLKADEPYTLKAIKPDKTYAYSDFLGFVKGEQNYTISLANSVLNFKRTLSPQEKAAEEEARRKAAIEAEAEAARKAAIEAETARKAAIEKNKILEEEKQKRDAQIALDNKFNDLMEKANQLMSENRIPSVEKAIEYYEAAMKLKPTNTDARDGYNKAKQIQENYQNTRKSWM